MKNSSQSSSLICQDQSKRTSLQEKQWQKIQTCWGKIEKEQVKKEKLEKNLILFFEEANAFGKEDITRYFETTYLVAEKLMSFIPYKSLDENRADNLLNFLDYLFWQYDESPFVENIKHINFNALKQRYHEKVKERLAKFHQDGEQGFFDNESDFRVIQTKISLLRIMLMEQLGITPDYTLKQWIAITLDISLLEAVHRHNLFASKEDSSAEFDENGMVICNEQQIEDIITEVKHAIEKLQDENETFGAEEDNKRDEHFFDGDFYEEKREDNTIHNELLFKQEDIGRIYRQLANKFHPDKLKNEEEKQLGMQLMPLITKAKNDKDIFTLLQIAMKYLDDVNFNLDDNSLKSMEINLNSKLSRMILDRKEFLASERPQQKMYNRFYHSNKSKRKAKLADYLSELRADTDFYQTYIITSKLTVKQVSKLIDHLSSV